MVKAVYDELAKEAPKSRFTVGINDDVCHTSLDVDPNFKLESDFFQAMFFGLGSDGTVGANKNSIKIIGNETDNYAQGYFVYDSKKSGSMTTSHLRFGKSIIDAPYLIEENQADFVACHHTPHLESVDMLKYAKDGATFLVNTPHSAETVWDTFPRPVQAEIIKKHLKVYVIDAYAVAAKTGMGRRINTVMQTCFFSKLGNVLDADTAIKYIKKYAEKTYAKKGMEVVQKNWDAIDASLANLHEVKVPATVTSTKEFREAIHGDAPAFVNEVTAEIIRGNGEKLPVSKMPVDGVFPTGTTKYEKIVAMIEETEKLKSAVESRAEHLADRLVPYTLAGTGLVYLLTRNVTKALSVLMVDFSCALKLSMPISVLSAMREAQSHGITVKGGKFLEAIAEADTIVFDKTGTITKAQPVVSDVISFCDEEPDELLRIAACLEEHFPHSMAKAVVRAAMDKGLVHEENHSKVEYIVAHGISSRIQDKKVIIGSYHFVFEDEQCVIPQGKEELFESLSGECSHLYLAIDGVLAAVIAITDPIREEAPQVVSMLRKCGLSKIVMMTGDSERTAKVVAAKVGVDEYYSEVLPEDKASYVEKEHQAGRKVIMIGDGVNDSPALSAADVGIAICDGAEMAREIADITIAGDNLEELVTLKRLSNALVKRIHGNYRQIVGFNTGLILCGIGGVMQPATSALLHNTSTLAISVKSMKDLLNEKDEK